jgi:crotonobetaine/carnitine-CoA ligase
MRPFTPFATVPELLSARAELVGDRTAATFAGEAITFAQLDDRAERVRGWLTQAGVREGDRVGLLLRNSLDFLYAWLGIAKAGAISVPINTAMMGDALHHNIAHPEMVGLIAEDDLLAAVDAAGSFPQLRWRVARGAPTDGAEPFGALLEHAPSGAGAAELDALSPMTLVYTSGTTGMPKGVVLPHQSFTNTGAYFARHLRYTIDDRLHTCLPLFHCNAQQCSFMPALHMGVPFLLDERFSLSRFWGWIEQSGATVTNLLGAMLSLIHKREPSPDDADNTLRCIAAGPIPPDIHRAFEQRFELVLVEGYGLTETGTMACINPIHDTRPGTIGLPLEHNELRVVDEHDVELPDDTPGEIVTRTHVPGAYMTEYFKAQEQTAEAMRGGWFHTGDLGKRRPDGYFVFLDRLKDTIRRRGENISSFMVEQSILQHPDVLQCAAFGVPSELSEDDVKVVCVLREGATLEPPELVAFCATRMADFMVPRYVELRDEIPLTETGRVHKFKLREEGVGAAWDAQPGGRAAR